MKILNLQFRNINSLKGDWEVHFDEKALADSNIFAITGPVGSGKTSILDAITLALFGKTSRVNENEVGEVMTKNARDCYSQIEFVVNDSKYRSRWGLRRADGEATGKLSAPFMELSELNGGEKVIGDGMNAVRSSISSLTGLDFQRFTRTVLLAQGDFAAFINAKEGERFEIFENITGSQLYAEIAQSAENRYEQEEKAIAELNRKLDEIVLLTPEEVSRTESEINARAESLRELEKRDSGTRWEIKQLEHYNRIESQYEECLNTLKIEQANQEAVDAEASKLEIAKTAFRIKAELDRAETLKKAALEADRRYKSIKSETEALEAQTASLQKSLDNDKAAMDEAAQNRAANEKSAEKALVLDRRIKTQEKQLAESKDRLQSLKKDRESQGRTKRDLTKALEENTSSKQEVSRKLSKRARDKSLAGDIPRIKDLLTRYADLRSKRENAEKLKKRTAEKIKTKKAELKKTRDQINRLRHDIEELAARKDDLEISMAALAGDTSVEKFEQRYKADVLRTELYHDLLRTAEKYAGYLEKRKKVQKVHEESGKILTDFIKERARLVQTLEQEKQRLNGINKTAARENKILYFEKNRKELKPGAHCPLCGAEDHPFVEHGTPNLGNASKELEAEKRKVKSIQTTLKKVDRKKARTQFKYSHSRKQLVEIDQKTAMLSSQWDELCKKTGDSLSIWNVQSLHADIKRLKAENRKRKNSIAHIRKLRKKHARIKMKWLKLKDQPRKVREDADHLETMVKNLENEYAVIEKELNWMIDAENGLRTDIQLLLTPYNEKVPDKGKERDLIKNLDDRLKTLLYYEERNESLDERRQSLQEKMTHLEETSAKTSDRIESLEKQISESETLISEAKRSRASLYGGLNPIAELKKMRQTEQERREAWYKSSLEFNKAHKKLTGKREMLKIRRIEAEKMMSEANHQERAVTEKMAAAGFSGPDALNSKMMSHTEMKRIEEKKAEAAERVKKAGYRYEAARRQYEAAKADVGTPRSRETLFEILNSVKNSREKIEQEIQRNREKLNRQAGLRKERERISAQIDARDKQRQRWRTLKTLSAAPEGYEFRKAVQSLTLDRLLNFGNHYLKQLNGRYEIVRHEDRLLEMELVDIYQSGVRRSLSNLSGGERFLVSFSMALGLSEISAKQSRIDSLFLDENFGLLDEESLRIVLNSLMKLGGGGRQIGVITHLEYLQSKIHPHIRLEKRIDEPGASRIINP